MISTTSNLSQPFSYKPVTTIFLQTSGSVSFEAWHKGLRHLFINNVPNFISRPKTLDICDSCAHGKHTRLPFKLVLNKSYMSFERLYCDIWGGYHIASLCGEHYFLTIVDEYSRVTWLYLMCFK